MSADIVTELRDIDTNNYFANKAILKAADEIERLRSEWETAIDDNADNDIESLHAEIARLRSERDEAIIHANNIVRESSSLITAKIPCGSCGSYWNAVDNFRRFESKTP